jgi:hypothetical protein
MPQTGAEAEEAAVAPDEAGVQVVEAEVEEEADRQLPRDEETMSELKTNNCLVD